MKEIINIIESSMTSARKSHYNADDCLFQLTMLAIATILGCLLEWMY
ncbi:MAG: hypothetical protein J6S96_00590 [Muribaculaceae bacterium]|nr:hypothetical protein [Muribaculaceae bacterium]